MFQIRIFGCCLLLETTNEHTYSLTILIYHACQVMSSIVFSAFYTKYFDPFRSFCLRRTDLLSKSEYICRIDRFFLQYIVYASVKKYRYIFPNTLLPKKAAEKRIMKKTQNAIFLQPKNRAPRQMTYTGIDGHRPLQIAVCRGQTAISPKKQRAPATFVTEARKSAFTGF